MKYYKDLATFNTFTLEDAEKIIGNNFTTKKYLENMIKNGSIHRIKKNLYTCYDFSTYSDCCNRFQIASNLNSDSFVSYHSAFEFYGFYNQVYFDVQVSSTKKIKYFEYDDYRYVNYLTNSLAQIDFIQGVRVSSIERTIVDSINMLGKVMDTEELIKCLDLISNVNESKLIEMLSIYNKPILYKKVGLVLSYYKNVYNISDTFFTLCKEKGNVSNIGYLINGNKLDMVFNSEWGLYSYPDLKKLVYKGGGIDV